MTANVNNKVILSMYELYQSRDFRGVRNNVQKYYYERE